MHSFVATGFVRGMAGLVVAIAHAGAIASAQTQLPPLRPIGPDLATSASFGAFETVIPLANGMVLLSDYRRRQVVLLDSSLRPVRVVLDSVPGRPNSYCSSATSVCYLLPFGADSAVHFDPGTATFLVIGPDGALGRTFAAPSGALGSAQAGIPLSSRALGFIWLTRMRSSPAPRAPTAVVDTVRVRDSLVVARHHYDTRKVDTIAHLETGTFSLRVSRGGSGSSSNAHPFPARDQLATISDGGLAVFHAREYRLDWYGPDGTLLPSARLIYPGQRLSEERRQSLMDSINGRRLAAYDSLLRLRAEDSVRLGRAPTRSMTVTVGGMPSVRDMPVPPPPRPLLAVDDDIPSYLPMAGSILGDAQGRLWIRRLTPQSPGLVQWDVISRSAGVVSSVSVSSDRTPIAFGPGVVYLAARDGGPMRLVKARIE